MASNVFTLIKWIESVESIAVIELLAKCCFYNWEFKKKLKQIYNLERTDFFPVVISQYDLLPKFAVESIEA